MRIRYRAAWAGVLIVAILMAAALSACGGGNDDNANNTGGADPRPMVAASATPSPTATVEDEVVAAYLLYSEAYKKALFDLDVKHVEGFASGEQLQRIRSEIENLRAQGLAGRIEVTHKPVVIQVTGNSATLLDEMVNNSFYVDARTKEPPVASGSGEILRDTFSLQKLDGKWVVTQSVRQKQGGQ